MRSVPLALIDVRLDQPRQSFNEAAMDELTESIRRRGVLTPIRVRVIGGGRYQVVAGQRRVVAARRAGLVSIPAVVVALDDDEAFLEALIENIQREDLNPLDRGAALHRLRVNLGAQSWEDVARVMGLSRRHIYNLLSISNLPRYIRDDIHSGNMNEKHGRALMRLRQSPHLQRQLWRRIASERMSGDQALSTAREMTGSRRQAQAGRPWRRRTQDGALTLAEAIRTLLRLLPVAGPDVIGGVRKDLTTLNRRLHEVMTDAFYAEEQLVDSSLRRLW